MAQLIRAEFAPEIWRRQFLCALGLGLTQRCQGARTRRGTDGAAVMSLPGIFAPKCDGRVPKSSIPSQIRPEPAQVWRGLYQVVHQQAQVRPGLHKVLHQPYEVGHESLPVHDGHDQVARESHQFRQESPPIRNGSHPVRARLPPVAGASPLVARPCQPPSGFGLRFKAGTFSPLTHLRNNMPFLIWHRRC